MDIQQEPAEAHAIQSYSDTDVTIQGVVYHTSTLISQPKIILNWPVYDIKALTPAHFTDILLLHPEVILIGHTQSGSFPPPEVIHYLAEKRIGIESMSVGAASRTFNILLSEHRQVVMGFIPNAAPPQH